ncbi:hypothetical protein J3R83DRAFT_8158 [Lanmaoa asiatica]|nr:hypothetical protein J3R83DRAFT_8158 [Lanmaoa asiatica]
MMASTSDAALKAEIARLTGAINQHKVAQHQPRPFSRSTQVPSSTRDVVIDGVAFESSSRSLVRKGRESPSNICYQAGIQPIHPSIQTPSSIHQSPPQADTPTHRLSQDNAWTPPPCPSGLQTKGIFSYPTTSTKEPQHDTRQHSSTNTGPSTQQAHEISQQTMPPFYYNRRPPRHATAVQVPAAVVSLVCTNTTPTRLRSAGTFCMATVPTLPNPAIFPMTPSRNVLPSVFISRTTGGVLGIIVRSLTFAWANDMASVATLQYSDFAERGTCSTKGCKLPHVIRANRNRKVPTTTRTGKTGSPSSDAAVPTVTSGSDSSSNNTSSSQQISVQDAQLGDEYISLMFNESEEESDDDSDDNATDAEDESTSDEEEGDGPTS